jgi:hypothetical protein
MEKAKTLEVLINLSIWNCQKIAYSPSTVTVTPELILYLN